MTPDEVRKALDSPPSEWMPADYYDDEVSLTAIFCEAAAIRLGQPEKKKRTSPELTTQ